MTNFEYPGLKDHPSAKEVSFRDGGNRAPKKHHQCGHHHHHEDHSNAESSWKHYVDHTSLHGVFQIQNSDTKWGRLVWILIVLAALGCLTYMLALRVEEYLQFKTTSQSVEYGMASADLPSITICNQNRYFPRRHFGTPDDEIREQQILSEIYDLGSVRYYNNDGTPVDNFPKFPIISAKLNDSYTLKDYMWDNGWTNGPGSYNMYVAPNMDRVEIDWQKFHSYISYRFGQCWTMDLNYTVQGAGGLYGMLILLDTKLESYTEAWEGNLGGGIVFRVHPKDEMPDVERYGLSVGAGMQANIGIQKFTYELQPKPWGSCNPKTPTLKHFDTYSTAKCIDECVGNYIIDKCGCKGPEFITHAETRVCTLEEQLYCIMPQLALAIRNSSSYDSCTELCEEPCFKEKYEVSLSYGSYPTNAIKNYFASAIPSELLEEQMRYNEKNFLQINFFYSSLTTVHTTESKAVDISSLLSDMGGQLGLFLGISVVTIAELLQFLLHFVYHAVLCRSK